MKKGIWINLVLAMSVMYISGCAKKKATPTEPTTAKETKKMDAQEESFGKTPDGKQINIYTLTNTNGIKVKIMSYGATVVSLQLPDRNGKIADVALGFDTLDGYLTSHPYFGVTVGRYANRIGGAKFTLDGVEYKLLIPFI